MRYLNLIGFLFLVSILASCKVYRPQQMLVDLNKDSLVGFTPVLQAQQIRAGDRLQIVVSSLNKEEDMLYNASSANGLEVRADGTLSFHRLGTKQVAGLTRGQLSTRLEKELTPFLKDPIVHVRFLNHRATIVVDNKPVVVELPEESIPFLEAMSKLSLSSGNVTAIQLNQVTRIRPALQQGQQVKMLDFTKSATLFNQENYYIQPDDTYIFRQDEQFVVREEKEKRFTRVFGYVLTGANLLILVAFNLFR